MPRLGELRYLTARDNWAHTVSEDQRSPSWDIRQMREHEGNVIYVEPYLRGPGPFDTVMDVMFRMTPQDAMQLARIIHDTAILALNNSDEMYCPIIRAEQDEERQRMTATIDDEDDYGMDIADELVSEDEDPFYP